MQTKKMAGKLNKNVVPWTLWITMKGCGSKINPPNYTPGWMHGWIDVKVVQRIAFSNQNSCFLNTSLPFCKKKHFLLFNQCLICAKLHFTFPKSAFSHVSFYYKHVIILMRCKRTNRKKVIQRFPTKEKRKTGWKRKNNIWL